MHMPVSLRRLRAYDGGLCITNRSRVYIIHTSGYRSGSTSRSRSRAGGRWPFSALLVWFASIHFSCSLAMALLVAEYLLGAPEGGWEVNAVNEVRQPVVDCAKDSNLSVCILFGHVLQRARGSDRSRAAHHARWYSHTHRVFPARAHRLQLVVPPARGRHLLHVPDVLPKGTTTHPISLPPQAALHIPQ